MQQYLTTAKGMEQPRQSFDPQKWVDNYADALYAYTITRIGDVQAAEDIVQNTFLSAWNARDSYRGQASEKNWLYAICKNKIIDYFRKKASSAHLVPAGEEALYFDDKDHWKKETAPKDWGMSATEPVESKEFYSVLDKCKQKLKEIQRSVFVMKYMEDIDSDEICRLLGITAANYWVLIHRAKLHLRKCLEKNWMDISQ